MPQSYGYTVIDYDREKSEFSWSVPDVLDDGSNLQAILTKSRLVYTKLLPICLFTDYSDRHFNISTRGSQAASSDPLAQRENKWLVTYADVSEFLDPPTDSVPNPGYNKVFNMEIPLAKLSIREDNSEVIYTKAGGGVNTDVADFVTALEDIARSPYSGAIDVLEIRSVGRNT